MIPHVPRLDFGPSIGCMVIRMEKQAFPAAWLHIHTASSRGTGRAGRGAAFPTSDFRLLLIAPHPFAGSADGSGPSALSACAVRILDVNKYACGVAALPFAHLSHSRRKAAFTTPGGAPKASRRDYRRAKSRPSKTRIRHAHTCRVRQGGQKRRSGAAHHLDGGKRQAPSDVTRPS